MDVLSFVAAAVAELGNRAEKSVEKKLKSGARQE
jgi:hypothetical protein